MWSRQQFYRTTTDRLCDAVCRPSPVYSVKARVLSASPCLLVCDYTSLCVCVKGVHILCLCALARAHVQHFAKRDLAARAGDR